MYVHVCPYICRYLLRCTCTTSRSKSYAQIIFTWIHFLHRQSASELALHSNNNFVTWYFLTVQLCTRLSTMSLVPIVPWYVVHGLAGMYRFRDGTMRMWIFSFRLQLGVIGWVFVGPKPIQAVSSSSRLLWVQSNLPVIIIKVLLWPWAERIRKDP